MTSFQWWQDAIDGKTPEAVIDDPQCGFYYTGRGADREPVAIYEDDDGIVASIGFDQRTIAPTAIWPRCYSHPITSDKYWAAVDSGAWADTEGLIEPKPPAPDPTGKNVVLSNEVEDDRPLEEIVDEKIEAALGVLNDTIPKNLDDITQEVADKLANSKDRLRELWKEAEEARKAEKKPLDEAAKAVQLKWKPVQEKAEVGGDKAERAIRHFLKREEAKRQAEARRREEERRQQEEARRAAEEAAKVAGEPPPPEPEPVEEQEPEPERTRVGGALSGRRTSLRVTRRYAVIDDFDKALEYFKGRPEIRDVVQTMANAAARAQTPVPGCTFKEELGAS